MVNQQLIDYIKSEEAQGYTVKQLYDYLIKQGYDSKEVNEAINLVNKRQAKSAKPVVIILVVLIMIIGASYFLFSGKTIGVVPTNNNQLVLSEEPAVEPEPEEPIIPLQEEKKEVTLEYEEVGSEYMDAFYPIEANGELIYAARTDNENNFIVYSDGHTGESYYKILPFSLVSIGGKAAFIAQKELSSNTVVVLDEQVIEAGYDRVSDLVNVNEKPAYKAGVGCAGKFICDEYFIVYDGQEIGKEYDSVSDLTGINGKLAYTAKKDNKTFIVYGGRELGKEYAHASNIQDVNGKIAYVATNKLEGDFDTRWFIVYEGRELGKEYDNQGLHLFDNYIIEIDDKVAFMVMNKEKGRLIVYDGQEIGKEFGGGQLGEGQRRISSLHEVNNKMVIVFSEGLLSRYIVYDGQEIGKEYTGIGSAITEVDGKLVFTAKKGANQVIVLASELP
ncbi:hypothetical protein KY360_00070 [Candidatus Woesearchaeota archaeon]|nr:hypothetical protein [Candidatus Woesearchaeota archaeon]